MKFTDLFKHPVFLLSLIAAIALMLMGREIWCPVGDFAIWSFDTNSQHNSQHLIDWYTPSHFLHGVIFFLLFGKRFTKYGLTFSLILEVFWELLENTSFVIERYREETLALNYFGDSVLNSVSDILFCAFGFLVASRSKLFSCILIFISFECLTLYFIRDNLTLNVLQLLYPLEVVKEWQLG